MIIFKTELSLSHKLKFLVLISLQPVIELKEIKLN
jgi:hypothetical protein